MSTRLQAQRRKSLQGRYTTPLVLRRGATTLAAQLVALVVEQRVSKQVRIWGAPDLDIAVGDWFTWNSMRCKVTLVAPERTTATVAAAEVAHTYDQAATIRRPILVSDGGLGRMESMSVLASAVPCVVLATGFTREERPMAGVVTASKLWQIIMPRDLLGSTVIPPDAEIVVGSDVYHVQNTNQGESHQIELIATCVKLTPTL